MQRALTSLFTRSLVQRSAVPRHATSSAASATFSIARQLHGSSIRLSDEISSNAMDKLGGGRGGAPFKGPNGVFVGGLDHEMNDEDLERVFSQFGKVAAANVVRDRDTQRSKKFGFVYFEEAEPVETVISDPSLVSELGPSVGVDKVKSSQSTPRSSSPFSSESRRPFQQRSAAPQNAESESVFIAGFPPSSSQSEIEAAIADFYPSSGIVNEVFLPLNRLERMEDEEASNGEAEGEPRRNKGYAFVRMTTKEDAKEFLDNMNRAIEDGFKFNGARYPPTASYATAKKASSDRSSSFRGGRGGGRDGGFRGGRDNRGGRNENRSPPEWLNQERQRFGGRGEEY